MKCKVQHNTLNKRYKNSLTHIIWNVKYSPTHLIRDIKHRLTHLIIKYSLTYFLRDIKYSLTHLMSGLDFYTLLLSELKSAELCVSWCRVPACRTDAQCLCDATYEGRRINHSALGKASKRTLCRRFSCSCPWVVCGTSIAAKGDGLEGFC